MKAWAIAYRALVAAFILAAALNMLRIRAGFFTNHLADLVVPAAIYVFCRGLAGHQPPVLVAWVGRTPERAAVFLFLASAASELSQIRWPQGAFAGRFDPWDIAAFGVGLIGCYAADAWSSRARAGRDPGQRTF